MICSPHMPAATAVVFASLSLALVGACSSAGAPGPAMTEDAGAAREPTPVAAPARAGARCVGEPVEAHTIGDLASCMRQGSQWNVHARTCSGTTFVVSCARGDRRLGSLPEDVVREQCLDMPGCGFTEADGTVTMPTGHCEGTKTPCTALDKSTCGSQPGCIYYDVEKCIAKNGLYYLDNASCASLQIGNAVSFTVVRNACRRAMGCRWID